MSEIIKKRVKENLGKNIKIFTNNNFRYIGKLVNCDDDFVEIFDEYIKGYKIIRISNIKDLEVRK